MNGIKIIINKESKSNIICYKNDFDNKLIIKLQSIIEKTQGEFLDF